LRAWPDVQVSLLLDDGGSDLIAENIDLSVRIAPRLRDTSQIAYKIAVVPQLLVATADYLARHGRPQRPKDLERHNCLTHQLKAATGNWFFSNPEGELHTVHVGGDFDSNLGEAILNLVKQHHGISMHPRYMVDDDVHDGTLEVVLPQYRCEDLNIYAIVQSKRYLPFKVRLFVDHLRSCFRNKNWSVAPTAPSRTGSGNRPG